MEQDEEDKVAATKVTAAGATLLPAPIANVVSLVTRSSSLYLRLGTFIGGLALDGARVTTLTGLELSRAVIEAILYRAGKDVSDRSIGEVGRSEAEGMLERSIATLHSTITNISFAASTGFCLSTVALESAGDLSQQLLGTLDSILGSTDSSRAIASIITLIRREFQNPATGQEGEKVSVADLLMGICGLALLQRWSRKLTDAENKDQKHEEIVWDVVILDNGRRADVIDKGSKIEERLLTQGKPSKAITFRTANGNEVLETLEREEGGEDLEDDMPEIRLKQRIMESLPANASVSITTSITTTKTITVEITGAHPPQLTPPPGVELVEENAHHTGGFALGDGGLANNQESGLSAPHYRVVYRTMRNKLRATSIDGHNIVQEADGFVDSIEVEDEPQTPPNPTLASKPSASNPSGSMYHRHDDPTTTTITADVVCSAEEPIHDASIISPTEQAANQKRSRKPLSAASSVSGSEAKLPQKATSGKVPVSKKLKSERPMLDKPAEKKGSFRKALRKGSGNTLSNIWNKDAPVSELSKGKPAHRPSRGAPTPPPKSHLPIPPRNSSVVPLRDIPLPPQRGNPNYFSSRDLGSPSENAPRSPSRASYFSIHEQRRASIVSQTDTYSLRSADGRPSSPTAYRAHLRAQSSLMRSVSDKNIANPTPSPKSHRRSKSFVPSIYTLNTNNSATSLILATQRPRSAFEDTQALEALMRTGHVDGLFPRYHLVRNITRFIRFASASYGSSFLRVMGIATYPDTGEAKEFDTSHHHEHHSFSSHTQLPADTILLSSFVDPQGGTDATGNTGTGVPMVHFVSLDHDSKAVILTCRGTLGFEDVLTDLTCEYDELQYRGKAYIVHKGIHASARRLLSSRVLVTIKAALEEFPDYGLVLCGHSLGGAVTALLAVMISEPLTSGTSFITSSQPYKPAQLLLPSPGNPGIAPAEMSHLPPGRPIHVYAYGPPSTISPSLRLATRGLITTIVHNQDLVPYLSLGVLHDLQAVALAFKTDDSGAKGEVRRRVWEGLQGTFKDKWYQNGGGTTQRDEDDEWAYSALKTLRASMLSVKLVPPGEVFIVESMPVLRRDAFSKNGDAGANIGGGLGRPATRSMLRYVRDVEKRFGEVRFGGSMLLDHSPGRYEASLGALKKGVLDS
ncbi:hypothetical protein B0O99DRAFT_616575 [Bisporella sp. PMI_857]|nr:hypothetical protein B0O99DRAFT_616575 [Bisporella sp. PMI_857]